MSSTDQGGELTVIADDATAFPHCTDNAYRKDAQEKNTDQNPKIKGIT